MAIQGGVLQGVVSGQNPNQQAPQYTGPNEYAKDIGYQNRMAWGGHAGGAEEATKRYQGLGEAAANRKAYQADYSQYNADRANAGADRGNALADRNLALGSRNEQLDALSMQRQAALGNQPSKAELLGRGMINQSIDAQQAAAASARGGSLAQAAAARSAADAGGAYRANGMNQLSALRADEMAHARDAYAGSANALRSSDYQGQALDYQGQGLDYQGAGLSLGKTAQDIQNEQFQRNLNQTGQLAYEGMGADVANAQLGANVQNQRTAEQQSESNIQAGAHSSDFDTEKALKIGAAVVTGGGSILSGLAEGGPMPAPSLAESNAHAAAWTRARLGEHGDQYDSSLGSVGDRAAAAAPAHRPGLGSVIGGMFGGMSKSMNESPLHVAPIRAHAHGGPVSAQPYLVGEEGPELVVPKKDGYVMTAQQTAALLGAPPTQPQEEYLESRGLGNAMPQARAFGGPLMPELPAGSPDKMLESQGGLGWTKAGYSPANQYAEQNAQMMQVARHPGAMSSFAREEGGPVASARSSLAAARAAISERVALARSAASEALAPSKSVAPQRAPREAVIIGTQVAPHMIVEKPWLAPAAETGHPMSSESVAKAARARGGPVMGLGRVAAMRRCA